MLCEMYRLSYALICAALLLPATYGMQLFNEVAWGATMTGPALWSMAILLLGGILAFVLSLLLFNWDSQNRTGLHPALAALAIVPYAAGLLIF